MLNPIYNLPEMNFVGGETQTLVFNLMTASGQRFDANGCDIAFALINYSNKDGAPVLVKTASLREGETPPSTAIVDLTSEDTKNLYGRYVYQISIRDAEGEVEIPGQGLLDITRNIHRSFI